MTTTNVQKDYTPVKEFELSADEWASFERDLNEDRANEIITFHRREVPGYPDKPDWRGGSCVYRSIVDALDTVWDSDLHVSAYVCRQVVRRLNQDALGSVTVDMRWAFFDVDCEEAHKTGKGIPEGWRNQELSKIDRLLEAHPGLFVYFTGGGYRVVGRLPQEFAITSRDQADEEWTALYLRWVHYLFRVFGIEADPSCSNWNRMYRAPKVVRELKPSSGETKDQFEARQKVAKPENHPRFGSPKTIGVWDPKLTQEDLLSTFEEVVRREAPNGLDEVDTSIDAGNGIFYELLESRGLVLKESKSGKWFITCPDVEGHGSKTGPTDSFVGSPDLGRTWGHIHCSHSKHCQWGWADWKGFFSQSEIEEAKKNLGLNTPKERPVLPSDDDLDLGLGVSEEEPSELPATPDLRLVVDNDKPEPSNKSWLKLLDIKKTKGKSELRPTRNNVELVLRHVDHLKDLVCWNEITHCVCFARGLPVNWLAEYPGDTSIRRGTPIADEHIHHLDSILSHMKLAIKGLRDETTLNAVSDVAKLSRWNPLIEYFEGLKWDGKTRSESWLTDYCNVDDNPYSRFVGPRWLLSAVARGCVLGTKVDHTLMLEGEQGWNKSKALEVLGGDYYSHVDLGDLRNKESSLALQGAWILELAEGDILQRAHITALKAFATKGFDDVVKKYSNLVTRIQRSTVFAVTINRWDDTLIDPTGNRRFWPVRVNSRINIDKLQADRDQLWAEIYTLYKEGCMKWWPQTTEEEELCHEQQRQRQVEDPLLGDIRSIVEGIDGEVSVSTIISSAVTMEVIAKTDRSKQSTANKVGSLLRTLGWERKHTSEGNIWFRGPKAAPCTIPTTPDI